ncbi:MAG: efflux RND transporter periplasmic adaptor subunit [Rhodocyclaceae bacterium]|nr:MAG: efflux RND transporter periplasmic adaptor subunit [Rhodocyclaceae bacterium]
MNKGIAIVIAALFAGAMAGAYWLGQRHTGQVPNGVQATNAVAPVPANRPRKVLYYRNPMGLSDTSPVPKKDQMGMDYVAVYEDEGDTSDHAQGQVRISTEKIQKLGVRTEPVARHEIDRVIRAVGKVDAAEQRIFGISPRFEGWIEKVYVDKIYQLVAKGDPLIEVYNPELLSAQQEYVIAMEGLEKLKDGTPESREGMKRLAESALNRLRNWEISEKQIAELVKTRKVRQTLTLTSPLAGFVVDKKMIFVGMAFKPGQEIYAMADLLTSVWVIADVFEHEMDLVKDGQKATVTFSARPGQVFNAKVDYIYPILNPATRTTQVRLDVKNPTAQLFGAMYGDVVIDVGKAKGKVLAIPNSAVISSGMRNVVLVQLGEGRFEPRDVKLGMRGETYVEVLSGVAEGEQIVTAANFLIDAESNLKAALSAFGVSSGNAPGTGAAPRGMTQPTSAQPDMPKPALLPQPQGTPHEHQAMPVPAAPAPMGR